MNDNVEYLKSELLKSIVIYQHKGYEGFYVWDSVKNSTCIGSVELFPGIFATIRCRKIIERASRKWKEKECITFDIRNIRDRFEIISNNNESEFQQVSREEIYEVEENVDPRNVEYPDALLGGKNCRCPISDYFRDLHICGEYKVINESELVEKTRAIPAFAKMCLKSNCHKVLEDIKNHGYRYDPNDMIKIDEFGGNYYPIEGKHRICVMKRYGYNHMVPARVTHSKSCKTNSYLKVLYPPSRQHVIDYYKRCEKYGLSEDDVRTYLSDKNANLYSLIVMKLGL